ncbi:MAG: TlpA family protein disulfide reductase [Hyphomicrobiales bacterium]
MKSAQSGTAGVARPKSGRLAAFVVYKTPEEVDEVSFFDEDGNKKSLSDWRGKVVLVNFWATWCAPCRYEMPTLDAINARFGGPDFEVLAVSIDRSGFDKPRKFFADIEVKTLKLYNDSTSKSSRVLRAIGMPTTILIGRDGREIGRIAGPAEWDSEDAQELIRTAIAQTG